MPHWTDDLRSTLQHEILTLGEAGKAVFGDLHPKAKAPSLRQQVNDFLAMPLQERQQVALQLGPEGYKDWLDTNINNAMKVIGPGAAALYPYFQSDMPMPQEQPDPEMEVMQILAEALDGEEVIE